MSERGNLQVLSAACHQSFLLGDQSWGSFLGTAATDQVIKLFTIQTRKTVYMQASCPWSITLELHVNDQRHNNFLIVDGRLEQGVFNVEACSLRVGWRILIKSWSLTGRQLSPVMALVAHQRHLLPAAMLTRRMINLRRKVKRRYVDNSSILKQGAYINANYSIT